MEKSSMFDKLVTSISHEERLSLLDKIESYGTNIIHENAVDIEQDDGVCDLSLKLQNESWLFRFFLFIKSLFKSTNVEATYNNHLVANNAKIIEKTYSGILDYKQGFLLTNLYNRLKELKVAADFFKPYIINYEENPGDYYVFLGSLIIPEIYQQIDKEVDPYKLSFDREVTSELRASLLRKLDEILHNIPQEQRTRFYSSIQCLEWIKLFVRLPHERFLSKFISIVNGTFSCPIDTATSELASFAKILSGSRKIYAEVLETMYLLSPKAKEDQVDNLDIKDVTTKFIQKSIEQITIIKTFVATIPIKQLAAIAAKSATWKVGKIDGIEDWFVKFKTQWKKTFDKKWELWLRDRRKYVTKQRLVKLLGVNEYPFIPNRPWQLLWGGIPFAKDYTLGFLYAFFHKVYPKYNKLFKIITIEGDFSDRDNRIEFTDNYNEFNHTQEKIIELNNKLDSNGIYGSTFENVISESIRTIQGQSKIDSLLLTLESEASAIITNYCNAARNMVFILNGIVLGDTDSRYASLTNLSVIQGKNNAVFREDLFILKQGLLESVEIIKELETIELTSK